MVAFTNVTLVLGLSALALAGAAPEVADSPSGLKYEANIDSPKVQGSVSFTSTSEGKVEVGVHLLGLPESGGPFIYHIHQLPVPSDGNCTGTLEHLNPYGGSPDKTDPAEKEVGDLSGKHGGINGTSIHQTYIDPYISLNKDDPAYFGNLSVVVHLADKTRIGCANITAVRDSAADNTTSSSSVASVSATSNSANAAAQNTVTGVLLGAAVAALGLLY